MCWKLDEFAVLNILIAVCSNLNMVYTNQYQVKERQLFRWMNIWEKILSYKHLCVYFQLKDYTRDKKKETIFDKVFKRSLSAFHKEMQATISVEKQVRLYISTLFHMQFQMHHMYNGEQIYVYQLFGFL